MSFTVFGIGLKIPIRKPDLKSSLSLATPVHMLQIFPIFAWEIWKPGAGNLANVREKGKKRFSPGTVEGSDGHNG